MVEMLNLPAVETCFLEGSRALQSNVAPRCPNGLALDLLLVSQHLPSAPLLLRLSQQKALAAAPGCLGGGLQAQGRRSFIAPAFLAVISPLPLSKCCRDGGKSWKNMDYGKFFFFL